MSQYQKQLPSCGMLMAPVGSWNRPALTFHCITVSRLATATQMTARETNAAPQHFMPDAVFAATILISLGLGQPTVCWIAHFELRPGCT